MVEVKKRILHYLVILIVNIEVKKNRKLVSVGNGFPFMVALAEGPLERRFIVL